MPKPERISEPQLARTYRTCEVRSLTPHIGAEVRGIDLSQPLSDDQDKDIHEMWCDWKVLVFRDQRLRSVRLWPVRQSWEI